MNAQQQQAERTQPNPVQAEDVFLHVAGARMHVLRAGSGPPLVMIHGLIGSSYHWRSSVASLAPLATVYALDQLCAGKSERVRGLDADLEATADRVAKAMDELGIARADIVGHSHGGAVALMLAARHAERVRRLILFAPANPWSYPRNKLVRIFSTPPGRILARAAPYVPRSLQQAGLNRMFGDPARIPAGCLDAYMRDLRVPGTVSHVLRIVRGWFANMARLEAALPRVADVPTLLLWGDRDFAVTPASAAPLQRVLRRSELRIVPGGGHILFEEFPEEANRLMREWLGRGR